MSDVQQLPLFEADASTTWATGSRVLLTQHQLAAAFGMAPSTVSRWRLQAVERRGREIFYCLREAIQYRIGELGRLDLGQERARLARVQRERQALQLARERGEMIPADEIEAVWANYIAHCRARLLSLPETAAGRVAGATVPEVVGTLRGLVHEALTALAAYDPADFQPAPPPPAIGEAGASAAAPEPDAPPAPAKARGRRKKIKTKSGGNG